MKKTLLVIVSLLLAAANANASGGKIACFDNQSVFNKTMLGKKYQGIIRGYFESRQRILDMDAEEIQKLRDDRSTHKDAELNTPIQKEKEETLNRKIAEFEKIRAEFSNEVNEKNAELSNEFNQRVLAALKVIAKRDRLSLILNKTISTAKVEVQSVAYADEDLDITEQIVAEMDKKEEVAK